MAFKTLLLLLLLLMGVQGLTANDEYCGHRPLFSFKTRIVGGSESRLGQYPWQTSIFLFESYMCGGTIISPFWVVTVMHCIDSNGILKDSHFSVVAGVTEHPSREPHSQFRRVEKIIGHESYREDSNEHDIALLRLVSPLTFTDYVQPLCLPTNVKHEQDLGLHNCLISGFGATFFGGDNMQQLKGGNVVLFSHEKCNRVNWHYNSITENMICAGVESGAIDTCQGDSGGPLACYSSVDHRYYLIGVTSFGEGCGKPRKPGVYTRTSCYADWLTDKMAPYERMVEEDDETPEMMIDWPFGLNQIDSESRFAVSAAQKLDIGLALLVLSTAVMHF